MKYADGYLLLHILIFYSLIFVMLYFFILLISFN